MFTGIIECVGRVVNKFDHTTSVEFEVEADFVDEIKVDQSISHNGVCLTVTRIEGKSYFVTAIPETLKKTNLGSISSGDFFNLERSMKANGRFDGHMVQGHVDQTAVCSAIKKEGDSVIFTFTYDPDFGNFTVEKGSICLNGISLTVFNSRVGEFSVAIIPYTFENTNIKFIRINDKVNIEFDIVGKYLQNIFLKYKSNE
jgi:riboflavin synthase